MSEISEKETASSVIESPNDTPLVSVIIPSFNRANYLTEAVESVLKQTFINLECIIVDDGSTDNTRQVSEELMNQDARVKYLYKQNGGESSARNFGVENARGEWIQFLDSDDWLHPDKIRFQLSHLKGSKEDDIVFYSDYEIVFESEDNTRPRKHKPLILGLLTKDQWLERFCSSIGLQVACLLLKRKLCLQTKFTEKLRFGPDSKFHVDLLMKGNNYTYTPIVGLFHRKHSSNITGKVYEWPPGMKKDAIRFMLMVEEEYQSLKQLCQLGWVYFLKRAIRDADKEMFDEVIKHLQMPVSLDKIKLSNRFQIKLLYYIRLYVPNPKALLEFYRSIRQHWYSKSSI
ncbi:MAG: glycosyltransferase [Coleofasciculus sp. S288]|nr:glycosyltransferase [Coleofasciculus sp. S288]